MSTPALEQTATWSKRESPGEFSLTDNSRVAVLGGGPAGSFFAFFVLDMAQRVGLRLNVDIFEWRDFSTIGPSGCNMCGGIISESLVQTLAAEGISLPPSVVERAIDSYFLHMEEGSVRIDTPILEKRIASVHRGGGPKGTAETRWESFDNHLLDLAIHKGARLVRGRVDAVTMKNGKPLLSIGGSESQEYDFLAVAAGVNTSVLKLFEQLDLGYRAPGTTSTYISEFWMGAETIKAHLGSSMHVFLLNIPRVEFAAVIPKGEFASFCLLGHGIDERLFRTFLGHPHVRSVLPAGWELPDTVCHCSPRMQVRGARRPYADRVVFIGDAGTSRLFKDGIGSAYKTAKAAAATAVFEGVAGLHFRKRYAPVCRRIEHDNLIGQIVFMVTREIQRRRYNRRGVMRMTAEEQNDGGRAPRMSGVLWDTFTGSASYRDIFWRTLHPVFIGRLLAGVAGGLFRRGADAVPPTPPSDAMPA